MPEQPGLPASIFPRLPEDQVHGAMVPAFMCACRRILIALVGPYQLGDTLTCECGRLYALRREMIELSPNYAIPGKWYWHEL